MQLTKFTHSCVRFDDGERSLVIDPGVFSEVDQALDGVDAVLITHEHFDHVDADRLRAAAKANPRLRIWAPAAAASTFADLGEQVATSGAASSRRMCLASAPSTAANTAISTPGPPSRCKPVAAR